MRTDFTSQQQAAARGRGRSLIVSAAAGSGKTAVLVERVIGLVCDEEHPCGVENLLVVTFTNAAASEMRAKIASALLEQGSGRPILFHEVFPATLGGEQLSFGLFFEAIGQDLSVSEHVVHAGIMRLGWRVNTYHHTNSSRASGQIIPGGIPLILEPRKPRRPWSPHLGGLCHRCLGLLGHSTDRKPRLCMGCTIDLCRDRIMSAGASPGRRSLPVPSWPIQAMARSSGRVVDGIRRAEWG